MLVWDREYVMWLVKINKKDNGWILNLFTVQIYLVLEWNIL